MDALNESQRREVLQKILNAIERKFMGPEPDTKALREKHEARVLQSATAEEFEQAIVQLQEFAQKRSAFVLRELQKVRSASR